MEHPAEKCADLDVQRPPQGKPNNGAKAQSPKRADKQGFWKKKENAQEEPDSLSDDFQTALEDYKNAFYKEDEEEYDPYGPEDLHFDESEIDYVYLEHLPIEDHKFAYTNAVGPFLWKETFDHDIETGDWSIDLHHYHKSHWPAIGLNPTDTVPLSFKHRAKEIALPDEVKLEELDQATLTKLFGTSVPTPQSSTSSKKLEHLIAEESEGEASNPKDEESDGSVHSEGDLTQRQHLHYVIQERRIETAPNCLPDIHFDRFRPAANVIIQHFGLNFANSTVEMSDKLMNMIVHIGSSDMSIFPPTALKPENWEQMYDRVPGANLVPFYCALKLTMKGFKFYFEGFSTMCYHFVKVFNTGSPEVIFTYVLKVFASIPNSVMRMETPWYYPVFNGKFIFAGEEKSFMVAEAKKYDALASFDEEDAERVYNFWTHNGCRAADLIDYISDYCFVPHPKLVLWLRQNPEIAMQDCRSVWHKAQRKMIYGTPEEQKREFEKFKARVETEGIDKKVHNLVDEAVETVKAGAKWTKDSLFALVNDLKKRLKKVTKMVTKQIFVGLLDVEWYVRMFGTIIATIAFGYLAYKLWQTDSNALKALSVYCGITAGFGTAASMLYVAATIGEYLQPHQQGPGDKDDIEKKAENIAEATFNYFAGVFSQKTEIDIKKDHLRVMQVGNLSRIVKGLTSVTEIVTHATMWAAESMFFFATGKPLLEPHDEILYRDILSWTTEALNFLACDAHQAIKKDIHALREYKRLYYAMMKLQCQVQKSRIPGNTIGPFLSVCVRMQKLDQVLVQRLRQSVGRCRPVVLHLRGPPGTGKTVLTNVMAFDLFTLTKVGTGREYDESEFWNYPDDSEYKDGYNCQFATMIDDYYKSTSVEDCRKIAFEIIKMANDAPYNMTMAELEQKGVCFFVSEFLCLTANMRANEEFVLGLKSHEAFKRRIDFDVFIDVNLDGQAPGANPRDAYQNMRIVAMNGVPCNIVCNYYQLRHMLYNKMIHYHQTVGNIVQNVRQMQADPELLRLLQNAPVLSNLPIQGVRLTDATLPLNPNKNPDGGALNKYIDRAKNAFTIHSQGKREEDIKKTEELKAQLASLADKPKKPSPSTEASGNQALGGGEFDEGLDVECSALKAQFDKMSAKGVSTAVAIGGVVLGLAAIAGVAYKFSNKEDTDSPSVEAQNTSATPLSKPKNANRRPVRARTATRLVTVAQQVDQNDEDLLLLLKGNVGRLQAVEWNIGCTFITPQLLITAKHFNALVGKDDVVQVGLRDRTVYFRPDQIKRYESEIEDITYWVLDKPVEGVKSLLKHIASADDALDAVGFGCVFHHMTVPVEVPKVTFVGELEYCGEDDEVKTNADTFQVDFRTRSGDCGYVYSSQNAQMKSKIFGMQIAGGGGKGYGVFLRKEDILQYVPAQQSAHVDLEGINPTNVKLLGVVPPRESVRQPSRSNIAPTMMYANKSKTLPAFLRPVQGVSPLRKGIFAKHDRERCLLKPPHIDEAWKTVYATLKFPIEMRVLTIKESIKGTGQYVGSLDASTSSGYKWNTPEAEVKGKGKSPFMRMDADMEWEPTEYDEKLVEETMEALERGEEHPLHKHIITDCLKDERLDKKKLGEGIETFDDYLRANKLKKDVNIAADTRVMGPQPINYLQCERMLFGTFFANMRANRKKGGFVDLGLDVNSADWHETILRALDGVDPEVARLIAGDLKKCDSSLFRELLLAAWKILEKSYEGVWTEKQHKAAETLFKLIFLEQKRLAVDQLYETMGNPSGCFLTTIINCLCVAIIFTCIMYEKGVPEKKMFAVLNRLRTFGDDHLIVFHPTDMLFNMFDVEEWCARYGMKYTSIFKNEPMRDSFSFSEVKYLGRSIVKRNGFYYGALPKDEIEEIALWGPRDMPQSERTVSSQTAALREAFFWGREYYDELREKYNRFNALNDLPPHPFMWRTYYAMYFGLHFNAFELDGTLRFQEPEERIEMQIHQQSGKNTTGEQKLQPATDSLPGAERQESIGGVVSTTELTTRIDPVGKNNPGSDTSIPWTPLAIATNPYGSQGVEKALLRLTKVDAFAWSTAQNTGDAIANYAPFGALVAASSYLREKLTHFRYVRAGIQIEFRVNTTEFHAGKLLIAWAPRDPYKVPVPLLTVSPFDSMVAASGLNHVIISANQQQTGSFIIPFISNNYYIDLLDPNWGEGLGYLYVYVLHELRNGQCMEAMSTTVSMSACLLDPVVAAPTVPHALAYEPKTTNPFSIRRPRIYQQAEKAEVESVVPKGTLSGIARSVERTAIAVSEIPPLKPMADVVGSVASVVGNVLDKFGLSLPSSQTTVQSSRIRPTQSFAYMSGVSTADRLCADPDNHVANDGIVYCQVEDFDLIHVYCGIPMITDLVTFDASLAEGDLIWRIPVNPGHHYTYINPETEWEHILTYGANVYNMFDYWRGSMRYHIMFTANKFTSCRLQIYWMAGPVVTDLAILHANGDLIAVVNDIKGDASIKFSIPYLHHRPWLRTRRTDLETLNGDEVNGQIYITVYNPIIGCQEMGDTQIQMCVWTACGDDIEFAHPCEFKTKYNEPPEAKKIKAQSGKDDDKVDEVKQEDLSGVEEVIDDGKKQKKTCRKVRLPRAKKGKINTDQGAALQASMYMNMRVLFRNPFPPIISAGGQFTDKVNFGEHIGRLSSILFRPFFFESYSGQSTYLLSTPSIEVPGEPSCHLRIMNSFLFNRGSRRFHIVIGASTGTNFSDACYIQEVIPDNEEYPVPTRMNATDVHFVHLNNVIEHTVPFYTRNNLYMEDQALADENPNHGEPEVHYQFTQTATFRAFSSYGDDISLGWPITPCPLYDTVIPSKRDSRYDDCKGTKVNIPSTRIAAQTYARKKRQDALRNKN